MTSNRTGKIAEHLPHIPKIYRVGYESAVSGTSRKSGVDSFCLECVGWQKDEVRLCTSLECSLYPYRPYKLRSKQASQVVGFNAESTRGGLDDHGQE